MTPEEEVIRAGKAEQLMKDPLIVEAFSEIEKGLLALIQTSAFKDAESREKYCQMLINLACVKQHLHTTMDTGKFAVEQMRQKNLWGKAKNVVGLQ